MGKDGEWEWGFHVLYALWGEGVVFCKELGVFARENIVCYSCYAVFISESEAEGEH